MCCNAHIRCGGDVVESILQQQSSCWGMGRQNGHEKKAFSASAVGRVGGLFRLIHALRSLDGSRLRELLPLAPAPEGCAQYQSRSVQSIGSFTAP